MVTSSVRKQQGNRTITKKKVTIIMAKSATTKETQEVPQVEFSTDGPPPATRRGSGRWVDVAKQARENADKWGHVTLPTDSKAASCAGSLQKQGCETTRRTISETEHQVWFVFLSDEARAAKEAEEANAAE